MRSLILDRGLKCCLIVYDTCEVEIVDSSNLEKAIYKFKFQSKYKNPKPIEAFPNLNFRKIRPTSADNFQTLGVANKRRLL